MKKILYTTLLFIVASCSTTHPDYEANKKLAQKWVETFETGNIELWEEVVSKDVVDISPMYGMGEINYEGSKQIAEFRENLKHLKILIIDEMSLLGADMLYKIHLRLSQEIFQNDLLFGGISVLLVGDLLQLPPVNAAFIFKQPKNCIALLVNF